jgi:citronellol/citronellal dehydrogenase
LSSGSILTITIGVLRLLYENLRWIRVTAEAHMATLKGRTLFITGASRGIGLAIALRAARDGANIAVAAKTAEPHPRLPGTIYTAAGEIEAAGGRALPVVCDIRFEDQVQAAVAKAVETFGGIDICINNASAISLTPTEQTDAKRFDLMVGINTRGTFLVSKACIPHLRKVENPHILMLSPPLDLQPKWFERHLAYSIAKYGMSLCVLGLAAELKKDGIAVNALWPRTTIATAAVNNLLGGDAMMRRSRKPEIVADAAHLILTQPAGNFTGRFVIDDTFLHEFGGVTDFTRYSVDPSVELSPDFFVPDDSPPPPGVKLAPLDARG